MSPDSSADGGESFVSPTHEALINPTPIAQGEEAAHPYATPLLSPNIKLEQDIIRIFKNIRDASYCGERPGDSAFTLFPKLPLEIRLDIWRHAILVPRIVEVDFVTNWFYRSKTLPPLLSCNRESRIECLRAYNDVIPKWIRFDWDILYLKQLDFSHSFIKPEYTYLSIQRWDPQEEEEISDESDKWMGRPVHFEDVTALAINREVLTQTFDDYECIIRHFFPHVKLLIVLIDDGITIHEAWDVKEGDFKAYESDWGDFCPRWNFTRASTGPFTCVSDENEDYETYVEKQMIKRFQREQDDYKDYNAPLINVRGCWLPPGVEIPECGRWPDDWDGWVRAIQ